MLIYSLRPGLGSKGLTLGNLGIQALPGSNVLSLDTNLLTLIRLRFLRLDFPAGEGGWSALPSFIFQEELI